MTRFLHLTDLHISHPDANDPKDKSASLDALRRVIGIINDMARQPDFVVASGDLTNMGDVASYELLRETLAPLKAPLVTALGNHDIRAGFHEVFGAPGSDAPWRHDARHGDLHVITLDTSVAGRVAGAICDAQFDWLNDALARHADAPKLMVMHHPPRIDPDGLPWVSIDSASTDRLAAALSGRTIAGILSGHIHINRVSLWHGVPVVVSNGQDTSIDLLETTDLRLVEGMGMGMCDWRPSGLTVSFAPLVPEPREIGVIDQARLRAFS